jgi:hypothetical protein
MMYEANARRKAQGVTHKIYRSLHPMNVKAVSRNLTVLIGNNSSRNFPYLLLSLSFDNRYAQSILVEF